MAETPMLRGCPNCHALMVYDAATNAYHCPRPTAFCQKSYSAYYFAAHKEGEKR